MSRKFVVRRLVVSASHKAVINYVLTLYLRHQSSGDSRMKKTWGELTARPRGKVGGQHKCTSCMRGNED